MLWPKKISFQDVGINSLGSLIAWLIGSMMMIIIVFFATGLIDMTLEYSKSVWDGLKTNAMFPMVLSVITFVGTSMTMFLTYKVLTLSSPDSYKSSSMILGQMAFFWILTYMIITPVYMFMWLMDYSNLMTMFIVHTLILSLGTSIILELLNNYSYALMGTYGSFMGLFFSIIISLMIFSFFPSGTAKLFSLVVLLPMMNFSTTFFSQLFELLYYYYYTTFNQDQLWDIFAQIELEESEELSLEEEKNTI